MCDCGAHEKLVVCTCRCDHTKDRLDQLRAQNADLRRELAAADQLIQEQDRQYNKLSDELADDLHRVIDHFYVNGDDRYDYALHHIPYPYDDSGHAVCSIEPNDSLNKLVLAALRHECREGER